MAATTRKLPVAVKLPSGRSRRSDFLVPRLSPEQPMGFVGLRSGALAEHGLLVSVGESVSAADLLERARARLTSHRPDEELLALLERYVEALRSFRIGNVLALHPDPDAGFRLTLVSNRPPPMHPAPRLPG